MILSELVKKLKGLEDEGHGQKDVIIIHDSGDVFQLAETFTVDGDEINIEAQDYLDEDEEEEEEEEDSSDDYEMVDSEYIASVQTNSGLGG